MAVNSPASDRQKDYHRKTVGEWLELPFVWRIPVYQRHYAWDSKKESGPIHLFWETVEEQTVARLKGDKPAQHYLGAVLVDNKTEPGATDEIKSWDVVDGQQRLTTIQIALLALIRVATKHKLDLRAELEKYVYCDGKTRKQPGLQPTNFDYEQFRSVLQQTYNEVWTRSNAPVVSEENADESKIDSTFLFFQGKYQSLVKKHSQPQPENSVDAISPDEIRHEPQDILRAIMQTLTHGFDLVLIVLRQSDEAQRIFESLNNYAEPLTTFDLIRNNVFYRAAKIRSGKDEELFRQNNWQQLEDPYWEASATKRRGGNTHIEAYIARMLVAKMRKAFGFNRSDIFKTYKEFWKGFSSIDEEIEELVDYVGIYQYLDGAPVKNPVDPQTNFGVFRYEIWENRDFYPVIFSIVGSNASMEQKRKMIMLLESYVIRRGVCGLSPSHYNLYAVDICQKLGDAPDYEALNKALKSGQKNTTLFPDDPMVKSECRAKKFYRSDFQWYVFEQIEKSMHDPRAEKVVAPKSILTIDHILPQRWEENAEWKRVVLGTDESPEIVAVADLLIDTIGNLTMMSGKNNSAKSNRSWGEVKKLLSDSNMRLNQQLAEQESWGLENIQARCEKLAGKICEIWPYDIPDDSVQ